MAKHTYQEEIVQVSDGSASIDVKGKRLPENKVLCIQRVSVVNETSTEDTATIGVALGSAQYWFETLTLTVAGNYYALTDPTYVHSVRHLIVRFNGTTTGDVLKVFAYGYYLD